MVSIVRIVARDMLQQGVSRKLRTCAQFVGQHSLTPALAKSENAQSAVSRALSKHPTNAPEKCTHARRAIQASFNAIMDQS